MSMSGCCAGCWGNGKPLTRMRRWRVSKSLKLSKIVVIPMDRHRPFRMVFRQAQQPWGGIDQAMIEVYGVVPEYSGHGRPPTRKKPGRDWLYLQMVKQRDEHGHFLGTKLRAIYGSKSEVVELLGKSTAYIERSNLTSRTFNARQTRTSSRCPSGKRWLSLRKSFFTRPLPCWKIVTTTWCIHTKACVCRW